MTGSNGGLELGALCTAREALSRAIVRLYDTPPAPRRCETSGSSTPSALTLARMGDNARRSTVPKRAWATAQSHIRSLRPQPAKRRSLAAPRTELEEGI